MLSGARASKLPADHHFTSQHAGYTQGEQDPGRYSKGLIMKNASQLALRSNTMPIKQGPRAYLYKIGETVSFDAWGGYCQNPGDTFSVLAQLPPVGGDLQYRIKSANEPYQRMAAENQLKRVVGARE